MTDIIGPNSVGWEAVSVSSVVTACGHIIVRHTGPRLAVLAL